MSDHFTININPPPRARQLTQDLRLQTPPKVVYSLTEGPEPPLLASSSPPEFQLQCPGLGLMPTTVKKKKRRRVNQKPKTPAITPSRRRPRTVQFSLRSSRLSPPRFGTDDDPAARGSPHPSYNGQAAEAEDLVFASQVNRRLDFSALSPPNASQFGGFDDDYGFEFGVNEQFDPIIEDNDESDFEDEEEGAFLSVKEKHEAISERIRRIVGEYWAVLSGIAFTYARISERCFALQDWDFKRDYLWVPYLPHGRC